LQRGASARPTPEAYNFDKPQTELSPQTTIGHAARQWPTPKAYEDRGENYTTETTIRHWADGRQITLSQYARDIWPRPRADEGGPRRSRGVADTLTAVADLWTTPQAHDSQGGTPERVGRFGTTHGGANLADDVTLWQTPAVSPSFPPDPETAPAGNDCSPSGPTSRPRLSPAFVSMLMGLPPAWVWPYALTGSALWETRAYRSKRALHFDTLCERWGVTGDDET